mmetsp:Transcript_71127/g.179608  ORF Transcript_71127/g.179608 Transcript_71127/m.179608 type:complete len:882 (-) Transcript_71127:61-2706(-)
MARFGSVLFGACCFSLLVGAVECREGPDPEQPACVAAQQGHLEEPGDASGLLQRATSTVAAALDVVDAGEGGSRTVSKLPKSAAEALQQAAAASAAGAAPRRSGLGDGLGFEVKVAYKGSTEEYPPSQGNSLLQCPYGDWTNCLGNIDSWKSQNGDWFNYLQTAQFKVSPGSIPEYVWVNDGRQAGTAVNCARALYADQFRDFGLGSSRLYLDVGGDDWWNSEDRQDSDKNPVHITIVPYASATGACDGSDVSSFDASAVIAVWLSVYEPSSCGADEWCCDLGDQVGANQAPDGNDCLRIETNFEYQLSDDGSTHYLVYYGSLTRTMMQVEQQGKRAIRITLPEASDVQWPVNNLIQRFTIAPGATNLANCKTWASSGAAKCQVSGYEERTYLTSLQIIVDGIGRIDGFRWVGLYRSGNYEKGEVSFPADAETIAYIWDRSTIDFVYDTNPGFDQNHQPSPIQWRMLSSLLVLSSAYAGIDCNWHLAGDHNSYAIDVSGIQVAWGAHRGAGATQLNSHFTAGIASPGAPAFLDSNNLCSKIFDVKVVGNWVDASDGPENLGQYSLTSHSYLHINDDSIKQGVADLFAYFNTVLQGNVGSAVNVGLFGKNRGVDQSLVYKVFVHRITHNSFDPQVGGYDGNNGLVATRGCPTYTWTDQKLNAGLRDATVASVFLPELLTINSIDFAFALGVDARSNNLFCDTSRWVDGSAGPYIIDNLQFVDWQIFANPRLPARVYNYPEGHPVVWGLGPQWLRKSLIFTEDASWANPEWLADAAPLTIHDGGTGYYVCAACATLDLDQLVDPTSGASDAECPDQPRCYLASGVPGSQKNTYLYGEDRDDIGSTLIYPYNSAFGDSGRRRSNVNHRRRPFGRRRRCLEKRHD